MVTIFESITEQWLSFILPVNSYYYVCEWYFGSVVTQESSIGNIVKLGTSEYPGLK